MKNTRLTIFSLSVALILTACTSPSQKDSQKDKTQKSDQPSSQEVVSSNITLKDPEDTSMLSENCKAYVLMLTLNASACFTKMKYASNYMRLINKTLVH